MYVMEENSFLTEMAFRNLTKTEKNQEQRGQVVKLVLMVEPAAAVAILINSVLSTAMLHLL